MELMEQVTLATDQRRNVIQAMRNLYASIKMSSHNGHKEGHSCIRREFSRGFNVSDSGGVRCSKFGELTCNKSTLAKLLVGLSEEKRQAVLVCRVAATASFRAFGATGKLLNKRTNVRLFGMVNKVIVCTSLRFTCRSRLSLAPTRTAFLPFSLSSMCVGMCNVRQQTVQSHLTKGISDTFWRTNTRFPYKILGGGG